MKYIKFNSQFLLFSLIVLMGVGNAACIKDDEKVVPKTLDEYKTELSQIVGSEKGVVQNCVVGYDKGNFKSELLFADITSAYLSVLGDAETVLAMPDLTIADIMAANKAITSPGKDFNDNLWISDRRPIHELIVFCDTLRVHTPEGTEIGMASAEAINTFTLAITAAKAVRGASSSIERQIIEAVEKLNLALEIFQEAII